MLREFGVGRYQDQQHAMDVASSDRKNPSLDGLRYQTTNLHLRRNTFKLRYSCHKEIYTISFHSMSTWEVGQDLPETILR